MEFIQKTYNMVKAVAELEGWYKKQQDVLAHAWGSISHAWNAFLESLDSCWNIFSGFFQQLDAVLQVAMNYFRSTNEGRGIGETISDFFNEFVQKVFYRDMSEEQPAAARNEGAAQGERANAAGVEQEDIDPAEIVGRVLFAEQPAAAPAPSQARPRRRRR